MVEKHVGVCRRRGVGLVELLAGQVARLVTVADGGGRAEPGGVAYQRAPQRLGRADLEVHRKIPLVAPLLVQREDTVDEQDRVGRDGVRGALERSVVAKIERGGVLSAVAVRSERIE